MRIGGFSTLAHDASLAIVNENGDIEFASTNDRFSQWKHDALLSKTLIEKLTEVDLKVFYEDCHCPEWKERTYPYERMQSRNVPDERLSAYSYEWFNSPTKVRSAIAEMNLDHHRSHAASSFYTRPWESHNDTVMLTIDGAGKDSWTSNNIYTYDEKNNKLINHYSDSISIGHLYNKIGNYLGFDDFEEGTVMGLSCFGTPIYKHLINYIFEKESFLTDIAAERQERERSQKLLKLLDDKVDKNDANWKADVAASLQKVTEERIIMYAKMARKYGSKLCYAGGVAQNIIANSMIKDLFDDMWIVSDPTDGGGCLGAAAWAYCEEYGGNRINWKDAYLGYNIEREINPKEVVDYILEHKVCGIANGQAEFGPRALGNRSLIGDVRYDIKDTVNAIKKREKFRPFGPLILEEEFDKWFDGPTNGYMQYVCKPRHEFQSVIHVDGTCRVQTVPSDSRSIIRPILEEYFERTGVPMLLNTSLNIKGRPMINNEAHAEKFERRYKVKVF